MNDNCKEGVHYYFDENKNMVFTEKYHLEKGYCCSYGCRHCPYQYESVPEPLRTELLLKKSMNNTPLSVS